MSMFVCLSHTQINYRWLKTDGGVAGSSNWDDLHRRENFKNRNETRGNIKIREPKTDDTLVLCFFSQSLKYLSQVLRKKKCFPQITSDWTTKNKEKTQSLLQSLEGKSAVKIYQCWCTLSALTRISTDFKVNQWPWGRHHVWKWPADEAYVADEAKLWSHKSFP